MAGLKYFPHLAGSLILAASGAVGLMHKWEPAKGSPDAHLFVYEDKLAICFTRLPPQSVFDAATSHAWNFGVGKTCSSAAMKQWNFGNYLLGCQLLAFQYDGTTPNWSLSDGKFVQGLHNRRLDEKKVCLKDVK